MAQNFRQYAKIAVDAPFFNLLTYGVPDEFVGVISPGWRVMVPLGKRLATGFVIELKSELDKEIKGLKSIADVPDDEAIFTPELLRLCKFVADYYIAPLGETMAIALPTGVSIGTKQIIFLIKENEDLELPPAQQKIVSVLREGPLELKRLIEKVGKSAIRQIRELEKIGIVGREYDYKQHSPPKMVSIASPAADVTEELAKSIEQRAPKQAAILRFLLANKSAITTHLSKLFGAEALRTLIDKGFLKITKREVFRQSEGWLTSRREIISLTESQKNAISTIKSALEAKENAPLLLHGITGSGKTLVYLEAAKMVRQMGKGVIVLVPEVALTPQMWGSLREFFGEDVAVLHSYLSPGERADAWRKIRHGEVKIALGARSAIFAPMSNLGLIVVDEEHDSSYKQGRAPFYNGRDVAIMRAKMENAFVILGSATPSLESYYNSITGKYRLCEMPERVPGADLPKVEIVDLRKLRKFEKTFSPAVVERLHEQTQKGEQSILLLNRRGFSTSLICRECGFVPRCPNCDLTLTYHRVGDELKCHWCDYAIPAYDVCPACGHESFRHRGKGTQKIELELYDFISSERVHRIDSDAVSGKGALTKILEQFASQPGSVLVGTQMVAKGHDFPNVTLVVVVDADIGLTVPDFRSHERTFQLLAQVAGRAGRGIRPGWVIIQTRHPESFAVQCALTHNYKEFFRNTITHRQMLSYPPFSRLVRIIAHSKNSTSAENALRKILRAIVTRKIPGATPLNPTKPPLAKLKGEYRWHLIIKTLEIKSLLPFLHDVAKSPFKDVRIRIDVDPYEMM